MKRNKLVTEYRQKLEITNEIMNC